MRMRASFSAAVALVATSLVAGCSLTSGLMSTQPPGVAQQLLIRALERGLERIDVSRLAGRGATVEVFVQSGNENFVREFILTWFKAHGVRTAVDNPDFRVRAFATVYGTDRGETLIGIPAFQMPIVNIPFPEIALFKWARNRGQSEVRVVAFDGKGERVVEQFPLGIGHSKFDDFTILLFFGWSVTDVDRPAF